MKKRINITFHSRVLLSFLGLLLLAFAGAAFAMYIAAERAGRGLAEQQLLVASRVVQREFALRDKQLREATRAIAADFGFRQAISSGDLPTIASALDNQKLRVHADLAAMVDDAGFVIVSTDANFDSSLHGSVLDALKRDRQHQYLPTILMFEGKLLQIVVVPVRSPDTVGWTCMGFFLTDGILDSLKEMTGTEISLMGDKEGDASVVASTLSNSAREAMGRNQGGRDYISLIDQSARGEGREYSVVLQLPNEALTGPLTALRRELLLSGALITVVCMIAAILSVRVLVRPVRALSDAARSLQMSKRGERSVATADDELSQVAKAFHSLVRRAHYDALTGLPNRALLLERLTESLSRVKRGRRPLAVVFIDLNGFKAINDRLGHEMGDLVLRKTASRLSRAIVAPNTVARLGGDEFVLVLESVAQSDAVTIVEGLMQTVSTPMKAPGGSIRVGMSSGIAMFPDVSVDRDTLLKQADVAMYESKTLKRGPVLAKRGAVTVKPSIAAPVDVETVDGVDTWQGQWTGKDLATQRSKRITAINPNVRKAQPAAIPKDEAQRLDALYALGVLDTPPLASLDRVTRMTAKALSVPIVLVSLVDERRQWFKSRFGLDAKETARDVSFCAYAVYQRDTFVVGDASADHRFANNPLVTGEPNIRAYAGAPLYSSGGYALGTLCAIDRRPRHFSEGEVDTLQDFASIIEDIIRAGERRKPAKLSE